MKNKFRKIALIDGESIRNMNPLVLSEYEYVYYFFGAIQKGFDFDVEQEERELLSPINMTIIPIGKTGKNNLDFHLTSYVGRLNLEADKEVRLHVYSKDSGYDGVLDFYTKQGRICTRFETYKQLSSPKNTPPSQLETIKQTKVSKQQVKKNQPKQPKYEPSDEIKKIYTQLKKLQANQTPKKLTTLENFIKSRLGCTAKQSTNHIKTLREHHKLEIKSNKLNYSKLKL